MSMRFIDWHLAHKAAQEMANRLDLPVAIRKAKEYGEWGMNVHLARRNDSDFATAEIVFPDTKKGDNK